MQAVKKGGDRQAVHEVLKEHTQAARQKLKESGETVSLLEQLGNDPRIPLDQKELKELIQGHAFVGRAPDQVHEFLEEEVFPALRK
jgi:adenylosuccinate lyase